MTVIYQNNHFTLEHCDDCHIAGHLILRPKLKVKSLSDLPLEALESFGTTIAFGHSIVNKVIQPKKVYTLSFCEVLTDLHFHIFPRTEDLTQAYSSSNDSINGALFFDWARKQCQHPTADSLYLRKALEEMMGNLAV